MRNEEHVFLGAYWKNRRITAGEFVKLCYDFLAGLREFSSAFDHRCVAVGEMPGVVPVIVPKDYASFERLMLRAVPDPEHAYTNPESGNKEFTLESTIGAGFSIVFSDAGQDGVPATKLAVFVAAGGYGGPFTAPNHVLIEIPQEYREFWESRQRAKELLALVVSTWKPTYATLTSSELEKALDPKRRTPFSPGMLTYYSDDKIGRAADHTAHVEAAANGGVFLTIDAPYPWAAAADRFKPCFIRLNDAGLLQWPA